MFFLKAMPARDMVEAFAARHEGLDVTRVLGTLEALRRASVLTRRIDRHLAGHGLSQTQFLAMMMIARETERDSLRPAEIAERLDVSRPVLSTTLRALVERGLLAPAEGGTDRRTKPLRLTEAGREALDAVLPEYFALLQDANT